MEKMLELNYIFETRWISSEKMAVMRVIENWPILAKSLSDINQDLSFDKDTRATAKGLLNYLTDRNCLAILHFMGDLLNHLGEYSKKMQRVDGLMIDQSKTLKDLMSTLKKAEEKDDVLLKRMLSESSCNYEVGCTLQEFEEPETDVAFHNVDIPHGNKFKKRLSEIRSSLITSLLTELKSYFPFSEIDTYSVLRPINIPETIADQHYYGIEEITKFAMHLQLPVQDTINQWRHLLEYVTQHPEFCDRKKGKTKYFWHFFLNPEIYTGGEDIAYIVKSVLVTPISSADAERGFSTLFHIRNKRRARLTRSHLEAFIRIRMNASKDIKKFPAVLYAKIWVNQENRLLTDNTKGVVPTEDKPIQTLTNKYDDEEESEKKHFWMGVICSKF
jgi:hypothetical protein